MRSFVFSYRALLIRTEFENQQAWEAICQLIRAPIAGPGATFYANVEFLEDDELRDLSKEDLLPRMPAGYRPSFVFLVDRETVSNPGVPHPRGGFAPRARARFSRYPLHDSEHRE